MSEKISMINLKGGVGKTVSSINIAYSFAEFGKKVLIVDTDSQGNIATSLGVNPDELNVTLFQLMEKAINGVVTKEEVEECLLKLGDVDVLPSNSRLAEIDYRLMNAYRREFILNEGDCLYFDPTTPHSQNAMGGKDAKFLTVILL